MEKGMVVQIHCPLCGHLPVYREAEDSFSPNAYYCHSCNKGFDLCFNGCKRPVVTKVLNIHLCSNCVEKYNNLADRKAAADENKQFILFGGGQLLGSFSDRGQVDTAVEAAEKQGIAVNFHIIPVETNVMSKYIPQSEICKEI